MTRSCAVYLRTRGGTYAEQVSKQCFCGLSPHTRRNPDKSFLGNASERSISAHAEEPVVSLIQSGSVRVYLRTRGGTSPTYFHDLKEQTTDSMFRTG